MGKVSLRMHPSDSIGAQGVVWPRYKTDSPGKDRLIQDLNPSRIDLFDSL